jgi:hypothetical protein
VRQLVENHIMKAAENITERVQNLFPNFKRGKKSFGYKSIENFIKRKGIVDVGRYSYNNFTDT